MANIMLSIKPEYCEKILNGEKTIEIRKTMPKCELPCRVFIYCTKSTNKALVQMFGRYPYKGSLCGKVVAEFALNKIECLKEIDFVTLKKTCLTREQITKYSNGKSVYAWYIDDLKVYDQPKELSDFLSMKECYAKDWGDVENIGCWECCDTYDHGDCYFGKFEMEKAPQSWCYCEVVE